MTANHSRREFFTRSFGAQCAASMFNQRSIATENGNGDSFSFILLGDLHYDKLEHHDFRWLDAHHPNDHSQIRNYTRLTAEIMPTLFTAIKAKVAELQASKSRPAFVLQVGDLVEGLCGSEELAARQDSEAIDFIQRAELGVPFLFAKGNHDVTGDGAIDAFDRVLLPFMENQMHQVDQDAVNTRSNYSVNFGDAQFVFLDAYDKASFEWFESVASARTAQHFFVTIHPPVVPYGARANWYLYSDEKSATKRKQLLEILGKQRAIVLGGHLHKFSRLTRETGDGLFTQLAVSSVISALDQTPRDLIRGVDGYTGDQVKLEPNHSPTTEEDRRKIYEVERKYVTDFEYANSAGFAVIHVQASRVDATIHVGTKRDAFRNLILSG